MKQNAPSCERNRDPILAVLREALPTKGLVLEIAAGTGQHAVHFAAALPHLSWQPTDADEGALASIEVWRADAGLDNLLAPMAMDVLDPWPDLAPAAIYCCNMVHISPWECTLALLDGAAKALPEGGPLVLYGPFRRNGEHTAPSNIRFERWLQAQDARWGVRDLATITREARARHLALDRVAELPANNLVVVFRRSA